MLIPFFLVASLMVSMSFVPDTIYVESTNAFEVVKIEPEPEETINCSCIQCLQAWGHGITGNAWDLEPNYFGFPYEGDIALFYDGQYHAAEVTETYLKSFRIRECNYNKCKYSERVIQLDNPTLRGFIHRLSSPRS